MKFNFFANAIGMLVLLSIFLAADGKVKWWHFVPSAIVTGAITYRDITKED